VHKLKLAFIDLAYHARTKSTLFIRELLEGSFEITVFYDTSAEGGARPSPCEIDAGNFDIVLFFQVSPLDYVDTLRCRNLVFIPMYDEFGLADAGAAYHYRDMAFINFSSTVHESLLRRGGRGVFLRYYPDPRSLAAASFKNGTGLFFWRRTDAIGWKTVRALVGGDPRAFPIHYHTASDPGCKPDSISADDQSRFGIIYSDWFGSKAEYLDAVAKRRFFVAPRIKEGIGFSFLEAMAMGRVVLAHAAPTMSEYIEDGVNGYLFDATRPKRLDLSMAERVGQEARNTALAGWEAWEERKHEIIEYVESLAASAHSPLLERERYQRLHRAYKIESAFSIARLAIAWPLRRIVRAMRRVLEARRGA